MSARSLASCRIDKPWGRFDLGQGFADVETGGEPVGEIWFDGGEAELLVKYIFTSERLSVQVHPDDDAARAAGYPRGKDEAWLILSTGSDAQVALGMREATTREAIRAGALDGSIVDMLDWRDVVPDQAIYNEAGTVHAIGANVALIEVQQNVDVTYRLYDYGRDRPLHLDEATAVAKPIPYVNYAAAVDLGDGRRVLCEGGKFVMERWSWHGARSIALPDGISGWLAPLGGGGGSIDRARFGQGECWLVDGSAEVAIDPGGDVLFAYPLSQHLPFAG